MARADAAFAAVAGPMGTLAPERVTAIERRVRKPQPASSTTWQPPDEVDAAVEALTDLLQPPS